MPRKQSKYPALALTVIPARERTEPVDRKRIVWKLITDFPVTSRREAIEKLNWYAIRWKVIELLGNVLANAFQLAAAAAGGRLRLVVHVSSRQGRRPRRAPGDFRILWKVSIFQRMAYQLSFSIERKPPAIPS